MIREKFEYSDLLKDRLVSIRVDSSTGWKILKYSKRVFYDALWNVDSRLLQTRGLALNADNEIISRPFDKIFNWQENGADVDRKKMVYAHRKVNGFLICATYVSQYDKVCIHTTGTFDSEYVQMGSEWIHKTPRTLEMIKAHPDWTFMFEVCDPSDPHIIAEEAGLHFLAMRNVEDGLVLPSFAMAIDWQQRIPEVIEVRFGDLLDSMAECRHEGWVVYSFTDGEGYTPLLKLKSPHYLITKFLGRNKKALERMLTDPKAARKEIDEEYYDLIEWLADVYGPSFVNMDEQSRIAVVKRWFNSR